MRVLVTGAAGLLGVHLTDLLVRREDISEVIGVDNYSREFLHNPPFITSEHSEKKFRLIKSDYEDIETSLLNKLEPDVVVHLAAFVSIPESMEKPFEYFYNNEFGTFRFVQNIFRAKNQPALIYASSPEVYGNPRYVPMDEEHPLHPRSTYSVTKLAAEKHCMSLFEWYGYPVAVIRNFNTYGENQNLWAYAGVITSLINSALSGEPLAIHGDGTQTRDFLYVKDNVRAYSLLINKVDKLKGEVFNIGTGKQTSINELANMIKRLTNSDSKIIHTKARPGDLVALCADCSKIKEKLGWEPKFTLSEGLKKTISWYRRFVK